MNNNSLTSLNQTFSLQGADKLTGKVKLAVEREGSEIIKEAIVSNIHENARAFLTKTVLDNLAALSALEAHLTVTAPFGEDRYKFIVDAYAYGAAQKIRKW